MNFLVNAYIPIQDDIVEGPEQNFTMIDLLLSIWSTYNGKQIVTNSKKAPMCCMFGGIHCKHNIKPNVPWQMRSKVSRR